MNALEFLSNNLLYGGLGNLAAHVDLGMHRGPLLAYLISDPELSLQSILITAAIIGRIKAWTYVGWVALFSTLAGLRQLQARRAGCAEGCN